MNSLFKILIRLGILKNDLDYHVIRASMVIIFLFFGYSKWFSYEAQGLIPLVSHHLFSGFTLFLAYGAPVGFWELLNGYFACSCFGVLEQKTGRPRSHRGLFYVHLDYLDHPVSARRLAKSARGFPAMTDMVAFLMKDIGLLALCLYLLRQDLIRVLRSTTSSVPSFASHVRQQSEVPHGC